MLWIDLLSEDRVAVRFPYREGWIAEIKRLPDREWNKEKGYWEVPLNCLPQLAEIFNRTLESLPSEVVRAFKIKSQVRTELSIGNAYTLLKGADLPLEALEEVTSFRIQGAEYSKLYQNGRWDGYRHLMTKRNGLRFPTGLLASVEKVLTSAGIDYAVRDGREKPPPSTAWPTFGHELRDYQVKALKAVGKKERGVLQLATGAGKTLLAAHLLARKGLPALFFVHTKDLLYQAIRSFEEVLQKPIGQIGDGTVRIEDVTVATIQTTARAQDLKIVKEVPDEVPLWKDEGFETLTVTDREAILEALDRCRVAIFDECHHLPAETFFQIAMKLENAYYRYGLSATPWRSDRSDLMIEAALGSKLVKVTSTDLIKRGYLVPPKITMYEVLPTPKKLPRVYATIYKSEVVEHIERNKIIADVAGHMSRKGKTVLILVSQVQHGKNLEEMIPEATFIHGKDTSEVRNLALERLRERKDQVLIATTLADEGLDLPSLDVLILAGGGKSETRALQRIGRVIRPYPGKKSAIVVDFYDQTRYLEEHSKHRFEIYQTEDSFEVEIRPPHLPGKGKPRQKILAEN